ncbi:SDR family oxidoreductase [Methylobacterium trifolii]|uniref:SDR family oxidoreductase n=1 Tax=Methylobacterium trifolii TaxID=1003092 RepID=UPI0024B4B56D|nr:SDR family oxidoreductase [Methylobacterium trifolii]
MSGFRLTPLFDLTGRTALVTGGNSGIGLALARALGLAGASIVLTARREGDLRAAQAGLHAEAIACDTIPGDLAAPETATVLSGALSERGHRIDILVNAAGVNLRKPFEAVTAADFDTHMALHVRAPFLLTQALAPGMAERGSGRVLNIASLQSFRAFADSAPYGAAKGAVVQLTRAIAEAWSARGVTCNAIAPGFFPTPLTRAVFADAERAGRNAAQTAAGRNGELTDLYGAAVFLASDASAYVTGQTLPVDGGFTAK